MTSHTTGKWLLIISLILVIIGAINLGWIGVTSNSIISSINNATFRNQTLERFVYILIGLAGIYLLFTFPVLFKHE